MLRLPAELRNAIYETVVIADIRSRLRQEGLNVINGLRKAELSLPTNIDMTLYRRISQPPLALVCKSVREDLLPIYYTIARTCVVEEDVEGLICQCVDGLPGSGGFTKQLCCWCNGVLALQICVSLASFESGGMGLHSRNSMVMKALQVITNWPN